MLSEFAFTSVSLMIGVAFEVLVLVLGLSLVLGSFEKRIPMFREILG